MQQKRVGNDDCFKICVKITLIKKITQKLLAFWWCRFKFRRNKLVTGAISIPQLVSPADVEEQPYL